MKRRLFNVFAAVSLVLCIATVALWVRSQRQFDQVMLRPAVGFGLSGNSQLGVLWCSVFTTQKGGPSRWLTHTTRRLLPFGLNSAVPPTPPVAAGFGLFSAPTPWGRAWGAIIPHWAMALILLLPAMAWLNAALVRRRRAKIGRCIACGYDLRASPDRCPECGAVPAKLEVAT